MKSFIQTTSFTRRLRRLIVIISLFFVVGFLASYFSSTSFLNGLKEMDKVNQVFNLTSQVSESLNIAVKYAENILNDKNLSDTRYAFKKSVNLAKNKLNDAIDYTNTHPFLRENLEKSLVAIEHYEDVVTELIKDLKKTNNNSKDLEALKIDLVVAEQYILEAKDNIRKAQILLKSQSDLSFSSIYRHRFRPLYVAISLTILFFSFVIIAGFLLTRKLSRSVDNLNRATEVVSGGNLKYQAEILENDEIGRLTHEFNHMVTKLDYTMNHIKRLQDITATFSEALTSAQVFETIVMQGKEAMEAQSGGVGILNEDGTKVLMKQMTGYSAEVLQDFIHFPLELDTILTRVIKTRSEIFLENENQLLAYKDMPKSDLISFAVLPLIVEGTILGALSFGFKKERIFSQEEKDFVIALSRQCAQAIRRVKLFEDAKLAIQARDEFLSIASHELKTPLTPLKLQLQVLARRVQQGKTNELTDDKLLQLVDKSNLQISRLTTLIEDLLDVSRITTGKMTLNFERFEVSEMVLEIIDQYRQQLRLESTEIEHELSPNIFATLDRVRIEQVIINILTNAGKYAPGKTIKITLALNGSLARISIKDHGPGIEKAHQKRVFERFERVSDRNNIGGLGLGLYISKQIIEAHGGTIFVESVPGDGSTFIIDIPLAPENFVAASSKEENIQ